MACRHRHADDIRSAAGEILIAGGHEPLVIDGSDGVWCYIRSLEVTIWPAGAECAGTATWCVTVCYRGKGRWAVARGSGGNGPVLRSDGTRVHERIPSGCGGDRPAQVYYPLEEAMRLARDWAPGVRANRMTAAEVLAAHQQPGGCDDR